MGQEIATSHFDRNDFLRFERRLASEMALLHEFFRTQRFSSRRPVIGLELEAWLVNDQGLPQPQNSEFLHRMDSPNVVPELSQYNIEFNVEPHSLTGPALHLMETELQETWDATQQVAHQMGLKIAAIGTLPTLREEDLSIKVMSEGQRYRALNEQVLRLRRGRPIRLQIDGAESLTIEHRDVMLESAATSLQVHYQVPLSQSVRYFNAATIASAAVIGIAANSPWLFEKQLWAESRIPLFEQAVDIGGPFPRVNFGFGYALETLEEFFLENRSCHPVLLPMCLSEPVETLPHVRLHNGTIWRWNRPLIGFDECGKPHLRVEHRVMPAGPTITDMLANVAFATGLIHSLATTPKPPEESLTFLQSLANFDAACRKGLSAKITWLDGSEHPLRDLLIQELIPQSQQGLRDLGIAEPDILRLLGIIARRSESGQNGAVWQVEYVRRHGRDLQGLMKAYMQRQQAGRPVHEWDY